MFKFPYTNLHELNLDWILDKVKTLVENNDEFNDKADYAVETADEAKTIAEQAAQATIADGAVTTPKLANEAVTSPKIADGAITALKYALSSIPTSALSEGCVTSNKILDGTITENDISANAITTAKINNGAVTNAKIADGAVTSVKISAPETITVTYDSTKLENVLVIKILDFYFINFTILESVLPVGYSSIQFSFSGSGNLRTQPLLTICSQGSSDDAKIFNGYFLSNTFQMRASASNSSKLKCFCIAY